MDMFSSALKSLSSNINSNYVISSTPISTAGPWKIYDAKKKTSGKLASILILDRRSIDAHSGTHGRSRTSNLKRASEEVLERLKKEASSLARLRHPNILELVEPVEETRNRGLQFVTEPIIASLSDLLQMKEDQEKECDTKKNEGYCFSEGVEAHKEINDFQLDELGIQRGLEQIGRALEFLHDNAGLVHGNLTPDAIFINSKYDWKISGLGFSSPPDGSTKISSVACINLADALNIDLRLPRSTQLNLDYCSPDFVLDNNLNFAADMFSLGLLIITLYNLPHMSPLKANASVTTYKQLFSSSSSIPSSANGFLSSRPIPKYLTTSVLPRLILRQPDQRMTAKEFLQSPYFENVLISTIRFLEALPAKTPKEKAQFMRGLSAIIPSFPKPTLEKKILTALIEEMKDLGILSLVLKNIFTIINQLSSGKRCFSASVMPRMKEIFVPTINTKFSADRDSSKEAGLLVILENIQLISENCSSKEFKDNILPIIKFAIESPTHSVVDASLRRLSIFLPKLDFSTIKHELFPVIASVFSKTNSLGIKVRGLDAFLILCGGSNDQESTDDGFDSVNGTSNMAKKNSSIALDKFTMQEKIVPLIRVIKTKEPVVAIAALNVLRQIGLVADIEFISSDIFPILWNMSLGPLLDLNQFRLFMELIKKLSHRIETEHSKKLQDLSNHNQDKSENTYSFTSIDKNIFPINPNSTECTTIEFENLIKGPVNATNSMKSLNSGSDSSPTSETQNSETSIKNSFVYCTSSPASKKSGKSELILESSTAASEFLSNNYPSISGVPEVRLLQQTSTLMQPLKPQPLESSIQQPLSDLSTKAHLYAQPNIDWTAASFSKSSINMLGDLTQPPPFFPNNLSSRISATVNSNHTNSYDLQIPVRESCPEVKETAFLVPQHQNLSVYSIPPPPKFPTQNCLKPISQRQEINFLPQSYPVEILKPQKLTNKSGLDAWESLL